ncbi:MAG: HSF-type DNA-binding-domain-containing protein [Benjaminiella poitrasii]|nr:MAG: HSF-type DNA-binding-domain-containing protein [Benjaminiella poitrasii]
MFPVFFLSFYLFITMLQGHDVQSLTSHHDPSHYSSHVRELSLSAQFSKSLSLQQQPPGVTNTFVHKLFNMVIDDQYQHLIAWNYMGTSFIVCSMLEFSKEVLPKHFKHSNFSSFVRQLNMYGFHKINKSPRIRTENQIWEFSHPKFLRDRQDLLEDIKRKSFNTTTTTVIEGDHQQWIIPQGQQVHSMASQQSEMANQLIQLQKEYRIVMQELNDTRDKQDEQQRVLNHLMQFLLQQQQQQQRPVMVEQQQTPSIFVTTTPVKGLTVQTQNLYLPPSDDSQLYSPAPSAYHTALNSPASPFFIASTPNDDHLLFNPSSFTL